MPNRMMRWFEYGHLPESSADSCQACAATNWPNIMDRHACPKARKRRRGCASCWKPRIVSCAPGWNRRTWRNAICTANRIQQYQSAFAPEMPEPRQSCLRSAGGILQVVFNADMTIDEW